MIHNLLSILKIMSPGRRMQLAITCVLMLVGGVTEVISIGAVVPLLVFLTDTGGMETMPPVVSGMFTTLFGEGGGSVSQAATFLIAAAVTAAVVRLLLVWMSVRFVTGLGHDIGVRIFRSMLSQPYEVHVSRNSSDIVSGLEKVQVIVFGVLHPLFQGIVSVVIAGCIVVFLILFNPMVAMVAIGIMGAIYVLLSVVSSRALRHNSTILAVTQTARVQHVQEAVGAIRDIIISRTENFFFDAFRNDDRMFRQAQGWNSFIQMSPRFIVEGAGMVLLALYILHVSRQPEGLAFALPLIGAIALGAQRLLPLLQQMYYGWSALQGAESVLADVERLTRVGERRLLLAPAPDSPLAFEKAIAFDSVGFRYAAGIEPVFTGVELSIAKGSRIGVVGKTGSGKSTFVDLLMGLLHPTDGTIRIDDTPLTDANCFGWYGQIAHVPQSIYLVDGTVAANIAFGAPTATIDRDRMVRAAEIAQIRDYIESQPEGYETSIGERGVRLSGGQRQRLGLARAFYRQAPVLILDEATSALDTETEERVMKALSTFDDTITVIMIAHRLSTLRDCDAIVIVDETGIRMSDTSELRP